jgi:hypothetical protein
MIRSSRTMPTRLASRRQIAEAIERASRRFATACWLPPAGSGPISFAECRHMRREHIRQLCRSCGLLSITDATGSAIGRSRIGRRHHADRPPTICSATGPRQQAVSVVAGVAEYGRLLRSAAVGQSLFIGRMAAWLIGGTTVSRKVLEGLIRGQQPEPSAGTRCFNRNSVRRRHWHEQPTSSRNLSAAGEAKGVPPIRRQADPGRRQQAVRDRCEDRRQASALTAPPSIAMGYQRLISQV